MCTFQQPDQPREQAWGVPGVGGPVPGPRRGVLDLSDPVDVARFVADQEEFRATADGFQGFGATKPGDRVLLVTDTHYDPRVTQVLSLVLRERGAFVAELVLEAGADREFTEVDEFPAMMRHVSWKQWPRRYEGVHWVERLAADRGFDLVLMGRGGPGTMWPTPFRYENVPWFTLDQLTGPSTTFPREVNELVNRKLHAVFQESARGGRVHLTDKEGTDISWTMFDEYYGNEYLWARPEPIWGHVMAHATPPIIDREDADGVIAGTLNHFSRPFPVIRTYYEGGKLVNVEGGGAYGDGWREMVEETKDVKYPCFPSKGLFWLFEAAIGTNPKVLPEPPERMRWLSSGGGEKERHRAGALHMGIGTIWRDATEDWAAEQGILNGHLHIHQFFATLTVTTRTGGTINVIDDGHLVLLDDSEVRTVAGRYGNPDEVLAESWTPSIPGINAPGDYESDYARDPADWIYSGKRDSDLWSSRPQG